MDMTIHLYDQTFEGLLCCVFQGYKQKKHPDRILPHDAILPLFSEHISTIHTAPEEAQRVWQHISKKISSKALYNLYAAWLSEEEHAPMLIYKVIRKIVDNTSSLIEHDFSNDDILALFKLSQQVIKSKLHVIQFVRFQKTKDDIYFAPINPVHNALPLALEHFKDRFADQAWIIYDMPRNYGYYYTPPSHNTPSSHPLHKGHITEVTLNQQHFEQGHLKKERLAADEQLLQTTWARYFQALNIKERLNPKLHRQHMPSRFWPYLPEKNKT